MLLRAVFSGISNLRIFQIFLHSIKKITGGKPSWDDKGDFPASPCLRGLIKKKNNAHKRWVRRLKWGDATVERCEYTKLRNKVVNVSRREKRHFELGIALQTGTDAVKPF